MQNISQPSSINASPVTIETPQLTDSPSHVQSPTTHPYYDSKKKKVIDFIGGFILPIIIGLLVSICLGFLSNASMSSTNDLLGEMYGIMSFALPFLYIVSYIGLAIYYARLHRRYVVLGMVSTLILPFLVFGACLLVLTATLR